MGMNRNELSTPLDRNELIDRMGNEYDRLRKEGVQGKALDQTKASSFAATYGIAMLADYVVTLEERIVALENPVDSDY